VTGRSAGLLALLASIWGASYLLIKYGLEDFSAAELVFLRTALATAVLVAVVRLQGPQAWDALRACARRPGSALLLGATAIAVPFLLITYGEQEIPSGLTAVLVSPASLFVALFAPFLDRTESIGRVQAVGLVAGLAGVALLVGVETVHDLHQFLGAMAVLGASVLYALSGFVVKRGYAGVPPIVVSAVSCGVAALLTLPIAVATAEGHAPGARAVLAVAGLGLVGTALAFVVFYRLMADIGVGRASLVSYLAPGIALFYGAVLLDEAITWAAVAGLALILGGVALAARRPAPPEPATAQ
jgi:drug/metabolite transporter (DMT)-like permease